MRRTVWKTTHEYEDSVVALVPERSRPLSCAVNGDYRRSCFDIWWLTDPESHLVNKTVVVAGTGHSLDGRLEGIEFLDTLLVGQLRFHVFAPVGTI